MVGTVGGRDGWTSPLRAVATTALSRMPTTKDPIHGFFTSREVRKSNEKGKLVTSTFYK